MKKTTKKSPMMKIVSAAAMLAVSASMLATSTYAWFAMNTKVSVTGMQVTAKSDNTYLLINTGSNSTAALIQSGGLTTVPLTVENDEADLYPSAPCLTAAQAAYIPATTGKKVGGDAVTTAGAQVTNEATASLFTNWYTATASGVDAPTMLAGSARQLTSFDNYVIVKTCYLTVASGANNATNLTVTPTFTQKAGGTDIAAAKVLVTTSDGGFAALDSTNNGTAVDIKGSNTPLTDSTVITVKTYIYYDGDAAPVFTNNAANLAGAEITFDFDMTPVPAA
ncbi:MAG: hypothetical protein IKP78_02190 [Ruminococcus sp.]|nr:hypothetical protein [Ruminococcus sp.]